MHSHLRLRFKWAETSCTVTICWKKDKFILRGYRFKPCSYFVVVSSMGPVRIRHSSHDFGWQSSHSVDLAGWQAKMASIEIWIPWRNVHKPHLSCLTEQASDFAQLAPWHKQECWAVGYNVQWETSGSHSLHPANYPNAETAVLYPELSSSDRRQRRMSFLLTHDCCQSGWREWICFL